MSAHSSERNIRTQCDFSKNLHILNGFAEAKGQDIGWSVLASIKPVQLHDPGGTDKMKTNSTRVIHFCGENAEHFFDHWSIPSNDQISVGSNGCGTCNADGHRRTVKAISFDGGN